MVEKYDIIGKAYNATRKADPYITGRIIHHIRPTKHGVYLDIGCGTGNYTTSLHGFGLKMIGIDPSQEMLKTARQRNGEIDWFHGKAESLPLKDKIIDGIVATLTIHHWQDLTKGFCEAFRVLKPGGRMVVFTSTPIQMKGYWLNHYFPNMLKDSILQMPSLEKVKQSIYDARLNITDTEIYYIKPNLQDYFLYAGKHNPQLYFDEKIRKGISSFSSLANEAEVTKGLQRLSKDIESGSINKVMESHSSSNNGDYLFIIAQKAS